MDKIVLNNGKTMFGKIEKIKTDAIEFKESESGLIFEKLKVEVNYIQLGNRTYITFDDKGNELISEQLPELSNSSESKNKFLIGLSLGYGTLSMKDVNDDLMESQNFFYSHGFTTQSPEKIDGGLFLEGNIRFNIGKINFGVCGNYIGSNGEFRISNVSGLFYETYDASTFEVMGILEFLVPINKTNLNFLAQAGGGVGLAKVEYNAEFRDNATPSNNFKVKIDADGNYFSGRIKSGIQFIIKKIIIEAAIGYRFSNAGELKGTYYEGGLKYEDLPITDINGNPITFDYSGFIISAGISLSL